MGCSWPHLDNHLGYHVEVPIPAQQVYDLICEMMSQCGLVFARHEEEWRIVMYEEREAIDEARKVLRGWTKPPEPPQE